MATKTLTENKAIKWYVNCIITLLIMMVPGFIPAPAPITPFGMTVAGIFFGLIYGWCTTNFFFPSITALLLIGFTDYTTPTTAFSNIFSNPMVLLCLALMLALAILNVTGVTSYMANWIVNRRFIKGRPWLLIVMLYIAAAIIGLVGNVQGAVLIMWPLVKTIFEEVGYKKGEKTPAMVMFGIVVVGMSSALSMPFQMPAISVIAFMGAASGGAVSSFNSTAYLLFGVPIVLLCIIGMLLLFKFVFKIDVERFRNFEPKQEEVPPMNRNQKIGIEMFILLFVLLLAPSFFPVTTPVGAFIDNLGNVGSCLIVIALACIIMSKDGSLFVTFKQLADGVYWGVIFMFGSAMVISGAFNSEEAGLNAFLIERFGSLFSSFSPFVFMLVFMAIALIATNFLANSVVTAIMIPIGYNICPLLNINPLVMAALFVIINSTAILFPSSSPAGALLHDNEEWISKPRIYSWSIAYLVVVLVLTIAVGYPLCNVLFG